MPILSKSAKSIPESPIRKLVPLADAAKARGVKVYHLNIGQPDIESPEVALDAIRHVNRKILEYSPSQGYLSLRERLVSYYASYNIPLSADEILVTTGGSEAILFALMATLNPGDELIVLEPVYANYISIAKQLGINVVPLTRVIENGFALPSIDKFEDAVTPRTRAILVCNPNNPTGYVYTQQELHRLRDFVKEHDLFLISDEVYREFRYTSEPYLSAMHLEGAEENVIMIDSMSKRYSECGIRIGMFVTRNKALRAAVMKYCQARLSPPLLGQIAAEASIGVPSSYYKRVYDEYLARRNFFVEGLNRIEGVYSPMPQGAFYTVAQLPIDDSDRFCEWCLSEFEYEGQTVMMAPASGFYQTPGLGRREVRLAYVLNREELGRALIVLEKALQAYNSR